MTTEPRTLTVNDVIDNQPLSGFQVVTIVLCSLVLLLDGFDTQAMGFLVPPIAEELGIPLSAFGTVRMRSSFACTAAPDSDAWESGPGTPPDALVTPSAYPNARADAIRARRTRCREHDAATRLYPSRPAGEY